MRTVGLAIWGKFDSLEKLAALPLDPRLTHRSITTGHALILCRKFVEAERALMTADKHLLKLYANQMKADPSYWANTLHQQTLKFIEGLQKDPESVINTLQEDRLYTLDVLKLKQCAE